jgi:hypothetical protein
MSDRNGTFNIYRQATDQAVPDISGWQQSGRATTPSPDGTQLLYVVSESGRQLFGTLMRVPIGGRTQQILKEH